MNRTIRRTTRVVVGLLAMLALAIPATASAALPGGIVSNVDWDVRHSWVDYVTNPAWFGYLGQGSVTRTGGSASQTGYGATAWRSPWTDYQYGTRFAAPSDATSGGVRTVTLRGGISFAMSAHSIDVRLTDFKVVRETSGREHLVIDAYYDPISGSPVTQNDLDFADLVDVRGGPNNQLQLTSGGATVFNGGSNGSYRTGDAFGALVYNP